mgnify:CR=1 FL=1
MDLRLFLKGQWPVSDRHQSFTVYFRVASVCRLLPNGILSLSRKMCAAKLSCGCRPGDHQTRPHLALIHRIICLTKIICISPFPPTTNLLLLSLLYATMYQYNFPTLAWDWFCEKIFFKRNGHRITLWDFVPSCREENGHFALLC